MRKIFCSLDVENETDVLLNSVEEYFPDNEGIGYSDSEASGSENFPENKNFVHFFMLVNLYCLLIMDKKRLVWRYLCLIIAIRCQ